MGHTLAVPGGALAYDVEGSGPLIVLAHGRGDSRRAYRFMAPELVAAGYRVANLDLRGHGESSVGWPSHARTDIAQDLIALITHLGGPAVVVGQSISGGAATITAALAPDLVTAVVELAPFTREQRPSISGLLRNRRYRAGMLHLAAVMMRGSLKSWLRYLDLAVPAKPGDWESELAHTAAALSAPERMAEVQAMAQTSPGDAGAQLGSVRCPALIIMGGADPDWHDPRAEGQLIVADLPAGLGQLAVIEGAGHYPHTECPRETLALMLPFLSAVHTERATMAETEGESEVSERG